MNQIREMWQNPYVRLVAACVLCVIVLLIAFFTVFQSPKITTTYGGEGPIVSPDGKKIVYFKKVNNDSLAAYLMDSDGTHSKEILSPVKAVILSAVWSPDSKLVGLTQTFPDSHTAFVYKWEVDELTRLPFGYYISSFRPNGKGLLMGDPDPDAGEIHLVSLDGKEQDREATLYSDGSSPVYSPDGKQIAFIQYIDQHFYMAVMDVKTRTAKQLDKTSTSAQWSPDGKYLLYKQYATSPEDYDIKTVRPDGSELKTIVKGDQWTETDWSPDGKQIVFSKRMNNDKIAIFLMNSDGTNAHQISDGHGSDSAPQFTPDGKKIIFQSYRDGAMNIYSMNIDGSNVQQLTGKTGL